MEGDEHATARPGASFHIPLLTDEGAGGVRWRSQERPLAAPEAALRQWGDGKLLGGVPTVLEALELRAPARGPRAPLPPYRAILPDGPALTPLDFPLPLHTGLLGKAGGLSLFSPEPRLGHRCKLQTAKTTQRPRHSHLPTPAPPRTRAGPWPCPFLPASSGRTGGRACAG